MSLAEWFNWNFRRQRRDIDTTAARRSIPWPKKDAYEVKADRMSDTAKTRLFGDKR